ncbi:hypothetical protein KJ359_011711 [Pestalotiopsis sp. 9143b]|nr:hypothetical protein KJ359_011711 [Pestalotiopsis sp. 9143b]
MSGYNHDNVIAAVRSFYTFFATLPRLSADDILNPPETGWPDLTDAYLAGLGKTPIVCDLGSPCMPQYHTKPAEEFFEEWKNKYRTLEWAPLIANADDGIVFCYDAHSEEVRQIYRNHDWPDTFDRAACAEAIRGWESSH